MLLINLDGNTTLRVQVSTENDGNNRTSTLQSKNQTQRSNFASTREEYHLTAKDGNLHSQTLLLNGKVLTVNSSGSIPPLEPISVSSLDPITVAPFSVVFARFPDVNYPACSRSTQMEMDKFGLLIELLLFGVLQPIICIFF